MTLITQTQTQARKPTEQEYCHERLGDDFDRAISDYDTRRRVETLIDCFLTDEMVVGKSVLDVGCGLGFFSERLRQRGADILACDIGPGLVQKTRRRAKCPAEVADALALVDHFGPDRFDVVLSSECIEHTPSPADALGQMAGVLKPGGFLVLSTPNRLWYPAVRLATLLKLRPFDGHENFTSWRGVRRTLRDVRIRIVQEHGLHLLPFQFGLDRVSTWCDGRCQHLRGLMINICILGRKLSDEAAGRAA